MSQFRKFEFLKWGAFIREEIRESSSEFGKPAKTADLNESGAAARRRGAHPWKGQFEIFGGSLLVAAARRSVFSQK